jgi:hypothetical protein
MQYPIPSAPSPTEEGTLYSYTILLHYTHTLYQCTIAHGGWYTLHCTNIHYPQCTIAHGGGYAAWVEEGTDECTIANSHIHDLGAGGVRIGRAAVATDEWAVRGTHRITVSGNLIEDGGHIYQVSGMRLGWGCFEWAPSAVQQCSRRVGF